MTRVLGLTLVMVLMLGWASRTRAQTVVDPYRMEASIYGDVFFQLEPYGGFGLESVQAPMAGSVAMDRFGMLHGTSRVASGPRVAAARSPSKPSRASGYSGGSRVSRTQYSLPTGSLSWPGASRVILYTPAMRYQTYGGGYARGPYGSVDCGILYKGMSLGY
jgi:hypothetical protein